MFSCSPQKCLNIFGSPIEKKLTFGSLRKMDTLATYSSQCREVYSEIKGQCLNLFHYFIKKSIYNQGHWTFSYYNVQKRSVKDKIEE